MNLFPWRKKTEDPYPRSFTKRLTWRIMITLFAVMSIITVIIVSIAWAMTLVGGAVILEVGLEHRAKDVEQRMTEVYVAAFNTVPYIEENLQRPDRLSGIMRRIVKQNPQIRSCGISFVENYYPQKGRWFCPYAYRKEGSRFVATKTIGGKNEDYLQASWFQEALKAKDVYWSKPFFDSKDQTPLVALLVPIHDERDSTVAVMGVDISLDLLAELVSKNYGYNKDREEPWSAKRKRYYVIMDSLGTLLVHPEMDRVINKNYYDYLQKDSISDGNPIISDDTRGRDIDNLILDGEEVMVNYTDIEHTPWKMAFIFPEIYTEYLLYGIGGLFTLFIAIGLIVVFFAGRHGIKKVSRPLRQLAASANEVARGNFEAPLPKVNSRDEIHLLRDSFERMQHSLTKYISELQETTAQKASIESELKVAHDIQMAMLPKKFPPYPERNDIDIYGTLTPAKAVGGDLFDFHLRNNKLFFCIGDVSGKGVPASMFMAVTRTMFRNTSNHVSEPDRIVYALNNALVDGNDTNMFVTLFAGVLDLETGHLRYCNAGHDAPLLVGRTVAELPCQPNLPLGIMADLNFEQQEIDIDPQTTIFLYTDGLNEAENAVHEQFGNYRIFEVANQLLKKNEHQPLNFNYEMFKAVKEFVGNAEQSDDLTMLAIQYLGVKS
jgi:sigma-B regulation protein RsbU (phosphoserine phosphatase)